MSILGAVARLRPQHLSAVLPRLHAFPGLDVALNPGDGRLVLVVEDAVTAERTHAASDTLGDIATWPEIMSLTLVYEYSGPDAPALAATQLADFNAWRVQPGARSTQPSAQP